MDSNGALLPNFLAVTNMKLSNMQLIREAQTNGSWPPAWPMRNFSSTRIARRRWRIAWPKQLAVTFHQKLGSLHQKTQRVIAMAAHVAGQLGG